MTGVSGLYGLDARGDEPRPYEVYAVRYGTLPGCPVSFLVQGAEPQPKVDLAMTVWVLKGPDGRTVLVDAGFYRPQFFKEFEGIADYTRPTGRSGDSGSSRKRSPTSTRCASRITGISYLPRPFTRLAGNRFWSITA